MGEISAKDGPIDRLSTEQRHRVVMASGERHHLAATEITLSSMGTNLQRISFQILVRSPKPFRKMV
jgi:hypothetical protein